MDLHNYSGQLLEFLQSICYNSINKHFLYGAAYGSSNIRTRKEYNMKSLDLLSREIASLEEKYGIYIIIKDMYSIMQTDPQLAVLLSRYYSHENPYCRYIKSNEYAMSECAVSEHTQAGRKMNNSPEKYKNGQYSVCPFGIREFLYPIRCSGYTIGAIEAGCGSCGNEQFIECRDRAVDKYHYSAGKLDELYRNHVELLTLPDTEDFRNDIAFCGEVLSMLCDRLLAHINIAAFFKYNFILNESNIHVDVDRFLCGKRILSRNTAGENRVMTIVLNTITYIQNNYTQKITIEDIAKYCYCSPSTLSHVFAPNYGMTISKLIHTVRCDRAKALLKNSSMPVGQIAMECGFSSADYFTSVFKNLNGTTPTEFRVRFADNPQLSEHSD